LATDGEGRLYVAAGAPRLARFALTPSLRKIDVLELAPGVPLDGPFAVVGNRLRVVAASDRGHEIRSIELSKR
nr:hypothetical protein [Acidobacteriota bacterium]